MKSIARTQTLDEARAESADPLGVFVRLFRARKEAKAWHKAVLKWQEAETAYYQALAALNEACADAKNCAERKTDAETICSVF